jgi:hypothetical protein
VRIARRVWEEDVSDRKHKLLRQPGDALRLKYGYQRLKELDD